MTLQEYITESLSTNVKDRLMDIISSDNITDDIGKRMIMVYNHEYLDKSAIVEHIQNVGLGKNLQAIIRLLKEHDFLVPYGEIIRTGDYISEKDIIKGNNIYDILKKNYPSITDDMINEIALLNYADAEGIARGKFEILLDLFLEDITPMNTGAGDVNTTKTSYELKASGARMGSKSYSPVYIDNYINNILNTAASKKIYRLKNSMSNEDLTTKTYNQLSEVGLSDRECCDHMIKALFAQFDIAINGDGGRSYININGKKITVDLDYIYDKVFIGGKFNVKFMKRFHGCINILVYHNIENWDYMMVFRGKTSADIASRGDYFLIDSKEADSLVDLYEDRRFNLSKGGQDDNFNKYCILTAR